MKNKIEQVEQIIESLEKDIKKLHEKIAKLDKLKNSLWNYVDHEKGKFSCPQDFHEAICTTCKHVLPDFCTTHNFEKNEEELHYIFPYGMTVQAAEVCKHNVKGCAEWKKKHITIACGCEGTAYCMCGYNEDYCVRPSEEEKCPFCGRNLKFNGSGRILPLNWEEIIKWQ